MSYCKICHENGTGCCYLYEDDKKFMFGLTSSEILKISESTGIEPKNFVVLDTVPVDFYNSITSFSPIFKQTMPGRKRHRLLTYGDRCIFLGAGGCTLTYEVRPYYCRLYPFWFRVQFTNQGSWFGKQVIAEIKDIDCVVEDKFLDKELLLLISEKCLVQRDSNHYTEILRKLKLEKTELWVIFRELMTASYHHSTSSCLT